MRHFAWAGFRERLCRTIRIEMFHGLHQPGQRADGGAHREAVQSSSRSNCTSSTSGSQPDSGTGAGVTSMVSGLPSRRRRRTWKCGRLSATVRRVSGY